MPNPLYLFGMFRSGTTTMARALNAHPNMAFASDPFQDLFKILRSDVAEEIEQVIPFDAPLDDYYFDNEGLELFQTLQTADLDRPFPQGMLDTLIEKCSQRCKSFSPALAPAVTDLEGASYRELLSALHTRIAAVYGRGKSEIAYTGFKEVWATEFLPHVLRDSPNARALVMVRDPRAVAASRNVKDEKYPWEFLARQWRKLTDLGWMYARDPSFGSRVKLVRYEDMVFAPQDTFKDVCKFLGIEWVPSIADPSTYRDGGGSRWTQNSSFGSSGATFDPHAVSRWRDTLSATVIGYLDWLCSPDMRLVGYDIAEEGERRCDAGWMLDCPRIQPREQAKWMRGIVPVDRLSVHNIAASEALRKVLIDPSRLHTPACDVDHTLEAGAFLFPELLSTLRCLETDEANREA